jgi:hypothetical protein
MVIYVNLVESTTLSQMNKFFTFGHIYEKVDSIFLLDVNFNLLRMKK